MDEDDASLVRTDSMSQSQRRPQHRRMESVETRSSMDLPPDALLQVDGTSTSDKSPEFGVRHLTCCTPPTHWPSSMMRYSE